jgi:hypothetical protein
MSELLVDAIIVYTINLDNNILDVGQLEGMVV